MNIYFAASIRGGRSDVEIYEQLIKYLSNFGDVLTEHVADKKITSTGEEDPRDEFIHSRDLEWLLQSDVIVAEVSTPSLGIGYELGRAVEHNKRILCLYRPQEGKRLSAMIAGCKNITNAEYYTIDEAKREIDIFFKAHPLMSIHGRQNI